MNNYIKEIYKHLDEQKNPLYSHLAQVSLTKLEPTKDIHIRSKELIELANKEVLIQMYKFVSNSDGGQLIKAALSTLQQKAKKNQSLIIVNVLINTRGTLAECFYRKNDNDGLDQLKQELNCESFQINITRHRADAFGSFHSKLIIIDGNQVMIKSGEPIYLNDYNKHLLETAVISDFSLADEVRKEFVKAWNQDCETNLKMVDIESKKIIEEKYFSNIPGIFIGKRADGNPKVRLGPGGPFKIALIKAINIAKYSIKIITPNLNDPDIIDALAKACNRKVYVNIIMAKHHNDFFENKPGAGGKNKSKMAELVDKVSSKNYLYLQIRWATNSKLEIVDQEPYGVHGKYACIDDRLVLTGSTPLDLQGTYHSKEADVIFEDKDKALECNQVFFYDKFDSGKDYFADIYEEIVSKLKELVNEKESLTQFLVNPIRKIELDNLPAYKKSGQLLKMITPILERYGLKQSLEFIKSNFVIFQCENEEIEMSGTSIFCQSRVSTNTIDQSKNMITEAAQKNY